MGKRSKYRGVMVTTTPNGKLAFRIRVRLPDGTRARTKETTDKDATPENVAALEKQADVMAAEMRAGMFRYEKWFPESARKVGKASPRVAAPVFSRGNGSGPTIAEYFKAWMPRQQPPDVRPSLREAYQSHFDRHLTGLAGDWPLEDVSVGHLLWLRGELRKRTSLSNRNSGKPLSPKTIRNIVDGSLRALCRDARRIDGLKVDLQAFEDMEWPKLRWEPTPFTEEERDRILGWYAKRLWRVPGAKKKQPWPAYHAYVYTLFFTGCRPSELSAVRVRSVNLNSGTIRILESIDDGHVGDVKTQSSDRTVRLTPENAELLRGLLELRPEPNAFFFRDVYGGPINGGRFYNSFVEAQRAVSISPIRDLYSTKDTFMSVCMSNGVDLSWLSAQTGVSEWTIKKHYGRYMNHPDRDALELAKIRPPQAVVATENAAEPPRAAKSRPSRRRAAGRHAGGKVVRLKGSQTAENRS